MQQLKYTVCYISVGGLGIIAMIATVIYSLDYSDCYSIKEFMKEVVFGVEEK